jgi:hypothetical protein
MLDETFAVASYVRSRDGSTDLTSLTNRVYYVEQVVVNVDDDVTLSNRNYLVSVDATSKDIIVTLPTASFGEGRTCTVTKVDSSSHIVTIDSTSLIAGESSFDLLLQYESLTLFSNGTEWMVK